MYAPVIVAPAGIPVTGIVDVSVVSPEPDKVRFIVPDEVVVGPTVPPDAVSNCGVAPGHSEMAADERVTADGESR